MRSLLPPSAWLLVWMQRFLPAPVRRWTGQIFRPSVREWRSRRMERSLPVVDLSDRHISHLRVVVDREALLTELPAGGIVAEVGVAEGDFAASILRIARPRRLHLIDIWARDARYDGLRAGVERRFENEIRAGRVLIHQRLSTAQLAEFEDGYFDWVYLDTVHDYKTTERELALCRHKVRPDGLIAGHDYTRGNWRERVRYGVIEAVNEFCLRNDWEMVFLTHESHRHLSYAIKKMATPAEDLTA